MKTLIVLLSLLSFNAFAEEYYKCYNIQQVGGSEDTVMKLTKSIFSNSVKAVELLSEIKTNKIEATHNPLSSGNALFFGINQQAVEEASKMDFKVLTKEDTYVNHRIILSAGILKMEESGFAQYRKKTCFWNLPCFTNTYFYKCDKI